MKKKGCIIAVGVMVGLVAIACGFIFWMFTHAEIDQSNGPVSRDKALAHCSFPLPQSATNVQYASYVAGMQEGYFYVRFEAPVADCHSIAKSIFANHAKDFSITAIPEFHSVSHPDREQCAYLRIEWFDNDHISKGVVAGTGVCWEPRIWIDEERGIFYFKVAD